KSHIVNAFHSADKHHSRVSYDKKLMTAKRCSQLRVGPSHSRTDAAVSIRVTCRFVFNGPIVPKSVELFSALQRTIGGVRSPPIDTSPCYAINRKKFPARNPATCGR